MVPNDQEDLDPVKKWEEIYRKESPILYGYLLKKTGDELAGDILQDSFLKLLQIMKKGQKIENHKAYVFQIARNLLILEYKKRKLASLDEEIPFGINDNRFDPVQGIMKKEFLAILEQARKDLSEIDQEIFELRWTYGLTQKEIAQVLSKSERQIRRDIDRIVNEIRRKFKSAGWQESEVDLN